MTVPASSRVGEKEGFRAKIEHLLMDRYFGHFSEMLHLDADIHKYHYVSQGKTTIPNVDDGEELDATDVSGLP